MNSDTKNTLLRDMQALVFGILISVIIILVMNRDYPLVGHDYEYFIPRLIDTGLHIRNNGLTIQWYTPSFGGGLPAFPNPQHLEYSFVQILALWMNPWSAVLVSTLLICLAGYHFFYKVLHERLELSWASSVLGAMFFIGNGFSIEHLIAGQMGYQLFPLCAIILYALTDRHHPFVYNAAVSGMLIALMVYQAGFYLIVILTLSFCIVLPILRLYKPDLPDARRLAMTGICAISLAGLITASKIYATMSFMGHFPRQLSDVYAVGLLQALMSLIAQLLGVMFFEPMLILGGQNPEFLSGALANFTGAKYGIWETDISLSPLLIYFLLIGLAHAIMSLRASKKLTLDRSVIPTLVVLVISIWVTLELTFAKGLFYTISKQLPVFRSLHINVRFASTFILPLVIVGVFQLERFFLQKREMVYFPVFAFLTTLSLVSYFSLAADVHLREFDVSSSNSIFGKIQSGHTFPVRRLAEISPQTGFMELASSIAPYEPIFGYYLEDFTPQTHLGSVYEIDDGYFNMTNPVSLVFPEINNIEPFERIRSNERDKLETFLNRRQTEWNLPITQKILNPLSLVGLLISIGMLTMGGTPPLKTAARSRQPS